MGDFVRFLPLGRAVRVAGLGESPSRRDALADIVEQAARLVAVEGQDRQVFVEAFIEDAHLREDYDEVVAGSPSQTLTELAAVLRTGRRRGSRALSCGAEALLLLARDLDAEVDLDPSTAGALCLHLAASGPSKRRAALKGHTVRATDAQWSFGSGPVLEASATGIVAFLLGASDEPPKPPLLDPV